ncbi:MAG TPA: isochorismatase family protein [Acidimicrobiales bacterium]|nr:isochorismatase family protein [Acidimicrobiales bacterium]
MTTAPYPWPYDGRLDPARLALVVVGAQGWWAARTTEPTVALDALERTAKVVRDGGGVVVVVRRTGAGEPVFEPASDDLVVGCSGMSGFAGGPLDQRLRALGRDHLAVGGLGLETAVYSTLAAANDRGYECLALADGAAPHDPAVGERALSSITMSGGIFGAVGTTSDLSDLVLGAGPGPPAAPAAAIQDLYRKERA